MTEDKHLSVPDESGLLKAAIDKGVDVETLERLVALQERVMDRNAASEFAAAMATFQGECPPIAKTSTAQIVTKSGAKFGYSYAELDQIARTVGPILKTLGLSYTWDSTVENGMLACTCTVRHVNGHSTSATFTCPVGGGGRMSPAQESAAALTFARRQALIQALGLTTADPDTDATATSHEKISETQVADLDLLIENVSADRKKFLAYMRVANLKDIPASEYQVAVNALEAKRRAQ